MKLIKKIYSLALLGVLAVSLNSCDFSGLTDAADDFGVLVELEPINTSVTVQLIDAATGEFISNNVTANFGGENSSDIIDIYSDPISQREVGDGILNFGIDNSVAPSESNPAQIQLRLQANGYLSAVKTISVADEGANNFTINMIKKSAPPSGVEIEEGVAGSADESGVTNEDINIELSNTTDNSGEETGSSVEVAKGSMFTDQNGVALTGSLESSAIYYSPNEALAVEAVPDELVENVGDSAVTLLGAMDLTITDASGKIATNVQGGSGKIAANGNQLNDGSYILNFVLNGSTYRELQQLLRLAFISPTTAERVILYSNPQITNLPDGRVSLRYALNSEIFRSAALVYFSEQPCNSSLTFNRNGNEGIIPVRITERGFFRSADLQAGRNVLQLRNITRGSKTIRATLANDIYEESIDVCGTSNPTVDLPAPPAETIDSAIIEVGLTCPSGQKITVTDVPSASILYRRAGTEGQGKSWRTARNIQWNQNEDDNGRVEGGSFEISNVINGVNYDFIIKIDNENRKRTVTINGSTTSYTEQVADICE
ncbi:hypothetical protein [Gracilimonas sp.]|uniref:hypothetical protein n=1 Tax=Gracilimonas sp. TaxID=1974203 RepID=UPI0028726B69|nr:hypothetical protein [Gracilimonas sp.]